MTSGNAAYDAGLTLTQSKTDSSVTLRDYLRIVWQRKWIVVSVVAACTVAAFLVAFIQTPRYSATALLMYERPTNIADPLSPGSSMTDVNSLALELQSVVNNLGSQAVTASAHRILGATPGNTESFSVSGSILAPDSDSGANVSDTVAITADSPQAAFAAEVANAYAQAVIDTRVKANEDRLAAAIEAVRGQMGRFQTDAARLSPDYLLLAQRLSDLETAKATVTGGFKAIQPATTPTSPSTQTPARAAVLGFLVGLLPGVALAFIVAQLDTRVRTYREVGEILGRPVSGRLPILAKRDAQSRRLPVLDEPNGAYSEAIRVLRSNLDWAAVAGEWESLLVTSGRPKEGKSMTLCNLAVALARTGKRVIVVDADLWSPVVHRYFDLKNAVGLTTVVAKSTPLETVLQCVDIGDTMAAGVQVRTVAARKRMDSEAGSLRVLTSGPLPPHPGELTASERLSGVIEELVASDADVVLIDGPPLLGMGGSGDLARLVDGLLFVVDLTHCRRPVLEESRDVLDGMTCRILGAVVVGDAPRATSYYTTNINLRSESHTLSEPIRMRTSDTT